LYTKRVLIRIKGKRRMMIRNFSSLLYLLLSTTAKQSSAFASATSLQRQQYQNTAKAFTILNNRGWITRGGSSNNSASSSIPTTSQRANKSSTLFATTSSSSTSTNNIGESQPPPPPPPPPPVEDGSNCKNIAGNVVRSEFGGVEYYDTSTMSEFRVVFVLGGPGAGKGTQSENLINNYPCVHLSAGELLREEVNRVDSPHRVMIEDCLTNGKIVPVEVSLSLLQRAMEDIAEKRGRSIIYLVDGFPRNYDNLSGWNRCMSDENIASVWGVLMYKCPLKVLEERILLRAEQGSGRSDDNIKSAQKRFCTFEEMTVPVVETLRKVSTSLLRVHDIDGNRKIDDVWNDTQTIFNNLFANDVLTANANLLNAIQNNNEEQYRTLCSYTDKDTTTMKEHEGDANSNTIISISNATIEFQTGTKAVTSYDRIIMENNNDTPVRETRVWSHQGIQGWKCIHYYRKELSSS